MSYTFDDAQNEIDLGMESIGAPTQGTNHLATASEIIDELQQEYAPTIKMTQEQHDFILQRKYLVQRIHWEVKRTG